MVNIANIVNKAKLPFLIIRQRELGWTIYRLSLAIRQLTGVLRWQFPLRSWKERRLSEFLFPTISSDPPEYAHYRRTQCGARFFFHPDDRNYYRTALFRIQGSHHKNFILKVNRFLKEEYLYFSRFWGKLSRPFEWHRNPFTGQQTAKFIHWSNIPMYSNSGGDLKFIWEPSRFSATYYLVRAYWATNNEQYAKLFWEFVESWIIQNPPNHGANWKCGQEISLRIMAWLFGFYGFLDSSSTTPERIAKLSLAIAIQAERIEKFIDYALSQENNHAIGEALGLWTVGIMFPEFKCADRWREKGRRILEQEGTKQISKDGSYIQNSMNYHRVMLQYYLWAIRLGELNDVPLSRKLFERVRHASNFLHQLLDKASGHVPNYGSNDGALPLQLSCCDYRNYRPVLNAVTYLVSHTRSFPAGLWDEDLLWLFGTDALKAPYFPIKQKRFAAFKGGYYSLRGQDTWGMVRCTKYRKHSRGQPDQLHLDLWWKGHNIASDAGTYRYFAKEPFNNSLQKTEVHNTATVDDKPQMLEGTRFLWVSTAQGTVRHFAIDKKSVLEYFEGEHNGYNRVERSMIHRRSILRVGNVLWVIVDDLVVKGHKIHRFKVHWLLPDVPCQVDQKLKKINFHVENNTKFQFIFLVPFTKTCKTQLDLVVGSETTSYRGWISHYYGTKEPGLSVTIKSMGCGYQRLVSLFSLGTQVKANWKGRDEIVISLSGHTLSVQLNPVDYLSILKEVRLKSNIENKLNASLII